MALVLLIWKQISVAAWTGSDIFFLALLMPALKSLQGEMKVNAHNKIFSQGRIYFRFWGISTIVVLVILTLPILPSVSATVVGFNTASTIADFVLLVLAYVVVGEGFIIRVMGRYTSISDILDGSEKSSDVPHLIVMESSLIEAFLLQLVLLILDIALVVYTTLHPLAF